MLALQVEERAMAMACAENTAEREADMKELHYQFIPAENQTRKANLRSHSLFSIVNMLLEPN